MERDANYTAVGAFVILVVTMAGLFVYWYTGAREQRDYHRYEIYFEGSVSGLAVGGQVRYLGVDVGRVVRMRVDPRAADRVQVIADIDSTAPISDRTLAKLSLQGVTGLLFVDLQQGRGGLNLTPAVASERYPVIRSVSSDFDVFLATLPDLAGRARELLIRLDSALSAQNTAALTQTLANLQQASAQLPGTVSDAGHLLAELRATAADIRGLDANVNGTTERIGPNLARAVERLRDTADNLASGSSRLDQMIAENRGDLRAFTQRQSAGIPAADP